MKTILIRTAIAALAVASFGFAACTAGVEAKPQRLLFFETYKNLC